MITKILDELFRMGYSVEMYKEDSGNHYKVYIWPDVEVAFRDNRHLVCSTSGLTVRVALENALAWVKKIKA